jgi:hypothetical protein
VDAARGLVGLGEQGEIAQAAGPDSIGAGGALDGVLVAGLGHFCNPFA